LKVGSWELGVGSWELGVGTVFQGNITRDPCRVKEITCWYGEEKGHFFLWRDSSDPIALFDHFEKYLAPILAS
jgi:hypothetical protein